MACHTGCTIIDLNPGVGLWSSKLHDVIKPKNHILVEPAQSAYLPFLKPLLEAPGSRYLLRDWASTNQWKSNAYISEGLIPRLESAVTSDGRNNSLLIIANLSSASSKPRLNSSISAHLAIIDYIHQIRSNQNFQASGPVRMLMWMNDSYKSAILPRQVHHRRKLSVEIEMTCHVEEVVGRPASRVKFRREGFIDIESSERVAREMVRRNIQIPFHRQDETQRQVQKELSISAGENTTPSKYTHTLADTPRNWHTHLIQMEQAFQNSEFHGPIAEPVSLKPKPKPKSEREETFKDSEQLREIRIMRSRYKAQKKQKDALGDFLRAQEVIEKDIQNQTPNELQRQKKLNELKQLKLRLERVPKAVREAFYYTVDNRRAFNQDPPLFMWDRRTAEPIIAQDDEFWNPTTLALLDFKPKLPNEIPVTSMRTESFNLLMAALFTNSSSTLHCLNSLAPGAAEAIAPNVPALRNPRKGGQIDLSDLRVRCFTPEMIHEIVQAWEDWPFKPTITEMIGNSSKSPPI